MDERGEPQWQPITVLPFLTEQVAGGVELAREHLALLQEARGAYRISNADVAGVVRTWTQARADLTELLIEQGRRWQALNLSPDQRCEVDAYEALVAQELALVEQILGLADELKAWTIEALMAKSDTQLGLEALLGRQP